MDLWTTFCATVDRRGDRVALVEGDGATTFAQWHGRSLHYAAAFARRGVCRGDRVVVWMDRGAEMAAALHGLFAISAIPVILHRATTASQLAHALELTTPRLVVVATGTPLPADPSSAAILDSSEVGPIADRFVLPRPPLPTEPALVIFTSGSTGRPKGVTHTHGSHARGVATLCRYQGLRADDRILCPVPWSFDYGLKQGLYPTAAMGALQVLPSGPDVPGIVDAIVRHRPTVLSAIPTLFTHLLPQLSGVDLSSVRLVTSSGGHLPGSVRRDIFDRFPRAELVLNYGSTESFRTSFLDPSLARDHGGSVGRCVPGVDALIVRDDGTLAQPGEVGEIVHRGDYLFLGYWNDPEATARALRRDPLAPPDCPNPALALFTGDLGRFDADGLLHCLGRRDRQLKVMDVRVSPGEIEDTLLASGLVHEVAVFGRPHDSIGHVVWAAVVPRAGAGDDVERQLRRYARQTMTRYMAPRHYVMKDHLPRTTSGKTDYGALIEDADAAPGGEGDD